jgi:PrtD family type I secretion system ABC transporter
MAEFLNTWKGYFTYAAFLSCLINLAQLTFPFYMFSIYRNVIVSYSPYSLITITVVAIYVLVFFGIFHFIRARLLTRAGTALYKTLSSKVYQGMVQGQAASGGSFYGQGMADLETLREFFSGNAVTPLFDAPWAPFYLLLIYFIHPVLGIVATGGAVAVVALNVIQELLIRRSMTEANKWNNKNQRFIQAFLRNTEVVNGMGMSNAVADWFDRSNSRVIFNQTQSSRYAGAVQSIMKPLQNVIQVLIYCVGAYYAMTQGFSVGLMVAASIIMGRGLAPIMQTAATWKMTYQAKEAYKRLYGFEKTRAQQVKKMPLFIPRGRYVLSDATFGPQGGRALLRDITFSLSPGRSLGIIGPSGAGKTTLCKLMLGIHPCVRGRVLLDGMDAFLWDKEVAGGHMGYLPQEIDLFPGTLAQNIARFEPVEMEKVQQAAALCGLESLVESLPEGYETVVEGAGGARFSGGQKQIVGMARAVYGDPAVLVLDEPTSNLDEAAEQIVLNILIRLQQTRKTTCIMVTHKPSLLVAMDDILVLRQGRVALFGPRDEVFAKISGKPHGASDTGKAAT